MNKQQLAARIWRTANKMRSKIEANEYKDYILGFIFYKFLSDKEVAFLKENGVEGKELATITEDNADIVAYVQQNLGYFIDYRNLFSTWLSMGRDFTVANVRDALSAFDRKINPHHKKLFERIFDTLQTGLSKLGASSAEQSGAIRDLIALIRDIPTDGRQDYDVLGFVYEYLISNFAANAGKKAGEFYTPHEVSVMMSDIIAHHLRDRGDIKIYDPTSGSGSLLINIGKSVGRHVSERDRIKYYAQELKLNTFNLTRMNLIMRGIRPDNIEARNGDTLKDDWPWFDEADPQGTYDPLYVDAVVSNPPYSQEWDPAGVDTDPRYAEFGVAPKGCADFAFLLHDLYHVQPGGIMTIVLPHGVLYRGGSEKQIRTALVEKNHIDAIIGLPEKVFFGTGISTIVMVLKRSTRQADENVLFVDASRGCAKEGKNNRLRSCDIRRIVDAVTRREESPDFARLVSRDTIRANDYNLNISRYVDSSDRPERWDVYATMFGGIPSSELAALGKYWQAFPSLPQELFDVDEHGYSRLKVKDVRRAIVDNADYKAWRSSRDRAFASLATTLEQVLIPQMATLNIPRTAERLAADLFARHEGLPLLDPYASFQAFSDEWTQIANDLENIQSDGFLSSVRAVDDVVELRKVGNREEEVTVGCEGRVLPFALVQQQLLPDDLRAVADIEQRLSDIAAALGAIAEEMPPEEREKYCDDEGTAIVAKLVPKPRRGTAPQPGSTAHRLSRAYGLFTLEKVEKKNRTAAQKKFFDHTLHAVQTVDEPTALRLLRLKWFAPILSALDAVPDQVVASMADSINHLADKYATTYQDVTAQVRRSESRLHSLLGELTGSAADLAGIGQLRNTLNA